jgi:Ca-activated chloride channel family protein
MRYLLLSFLCAWTVFAQTGDPAKAQSAPPQAPVAGQTPAGPPIRVQVNEVIVPITVTDDKGKFVSDLDKKDFKIFDEGKEQNIQFFTRERSQPVVVGFLVDQSNASRMHWSKYQDAVMELVLTLLPGDKKFSGYLVGYSQDADLIVNTTSDPEKLVDKIRKMKPGGGSALYDAIYMACTSRELVKGEPIEPRRVIVIMGDGHDNASKHTLEQVLELAQRNLVTIYCVSTVGFGFNGEGEKNLQRLAEETGGRVENPLQGNYSDVSGYLSTPSDEGNYALKVGTGGYAAAIASGIFKSVANVTGEVTTQYIIRYIPQVDDTKKPRDFRRIEVKVNLANVKVRARKGYYPQAP